MIFDIAGSSAFLHGLAWNALNIGIAVLLIPPAAVQSLQEQFKQSR